MPKELTPEMKRYTFMSSGDCECDPCGMEETDDGEYVLHAVAASREVALQEREEAWKARFKAIVGEDAPDSAGNRVLGLQGRLEKAEALLKEAGNALTILIGIGSCSDPNCHSCTEARKTLSRISAFTQEKHP